MSDTYETDGYANPGHEGEEYDGDGYEGAGRDPASGGAEVSAPGQERTFAALPPARGRGFAESWWGRAWLQALEDTALDGAQVKKGRRLAREGRVGAVSVRPGRITAVVQDRDSTPYRSDVLLQQLSEEDWDRFLDMAVDRAGHIAALLDREMPPHLVEDAAADGVDLLPGIGDLDPECTCEAWDHCAHSAALCYQVARLLDQDPFVLLLMRGRGERRVLDDLQARITARPRSGNLRSPPARRTGGRAAYGRTRHSPRRRSCPRCPLHHRCPPSRAPRRRWTRRPNRSPASTRPPWKCWRPTAPSGPTGCWPKPCRPTTDSSPCRSG